MSEQELRDILMALLTGEWASLGERGEEGEPLIEVIATFEEAVSVARTVRYPYAEGRALYEWGLMYVGKPDPKQGRDQLEKAAEIFRKLGSLPYSELAQKAMAGPGPG